MADHDVILSSSDIFAINDSKTEKVFVPEWNGSVYIRTLAAFERDEFETSTVKIGKDGKEERNMANFRARYVALCVVDGNGKRLFTSNQEINMLGRKSVAALDLLFSKASDLNRMSKEDVDALTEGFDEAPEEGSTSD